MRPGAHIAVNAALCALDAELARPVPAETAAEVAKDFIRLGKETLIAARERRIRYAGTRHLMRATYRRSADASLALAAQYRCLAVEAMADAVSLREAA